MPNAWTIASGMPRFANHANPRSPRRENAGAIGVTGGAGTRTPPRIGSGRSRLSAPDHSQWWQSHNPDSVSTDRQRSR
jgi:hypothetical protein